MAHDSSSNNNTTFFQGLANGARRVRSLHLDELEKLENHLCVEGPGGPMLGGHRRDRTKFTKEQLKILIDTFNQMPYPGQATKQRLAVEVNAEESRIQVWFQNRRARHKFQERTLESSQGPGQDRTRERMQSEAPRCRTTYSRSQLHTLIRAFKNNPYPGIHRREELAKEIGVPESRVQIWFQNRRSRLRAQRRKEPDGSLGRGQGEGL
ncbi:double homeobox protein A-like [Sciurus carolinensis]|uniref:double homeobox protein A-like n=1 Tax=Sciurus carolinensis TaxID=30640 RepID=UPI001FB1F3B9|nr:double homeobox protein A-like [Sciurus carolinensis]